MASQNTRPPRLAEKVVDWLAAEFEPIAGDFAEEFAERVGENGRFSTSLWYYQQLIQSIPALARLNLINQYERKRQPMFTAVTKRNLQILALGSLMLIPSMLVGATGILHSVFGISAPMNNMFNFLRSSPLLEWIVHPITIMGGLAAAFFLNALPIFQVSVSNEQDRLVGFIAIRKGPIFHLIILSVVIMVVLFIFAYLLADNLGIF